MMITLFTGRGWVVPMMGKKGRIGTIFIFFARPQKELDFSSVIPEILRSVIAIMHQTPRSPSLSVNFFSYLDLARTLSMFIHATSTLSCTSCQQPSGLGAWLAHGRAPSHQSLTVPQEVAYGEAFMFANFTGKKLVRFTPSKQGHA
ncbi:hypothetical protein EAF04_008681 [Stromatinia cepivora]|nr:hypothetical protein EAF04_008681 [Stromatinia cepivora]